MRVLLGIRTRMGGLRVFTLKKRVNMYFIHCLVLRLRRLHMNLFSLDKQSTPTWQIGSLVKVKLLFLISPCNGTVSSISYLAMLNLYDGDPAAEVVLIPVSLICYWKCVDRCIDRPISQASSDAAPGYDTTTISLSDRFTEGTDTRSGR